MDPQTGNRQRRDHSLHGWAWLLDLGAFTVGLVLVPWRLWRAFIRGRRATNLYHTGFAEEQLATVTVGTLRTALGITTAQPRTRPVDLVAFVALAAVGILWHTAIAAAGFWIAWRIGRMTHHHTGEYYGKSGHAVGSSFH